MLQQTKYREQTEEWVNELFKFNNSVHLVIHYSDYLQTDKKKIFVSKIQRFVDDELVAINKRFFRRLEERVCIKGGRNRLRRLVVIEGKNGSSKHTHMIIEIPKDKDEEEFIVDIHNAVFMTKGMRNDYKDKVYEQKGLVNYLTKQSNRTIDNIDIRNRRY